MQSRGLRASRPGARALALLVGLATAGALGCVYHHHHYPESPPGVAKRHHSHGPPPHAPAHGYRHKHRDHQGAEVDLVFDADLDVYVVLGHPEHYHRDGAWFRWHDGHWEVAADFGGVWVRAGNDEVPSKLRRKLAKRKRRGKGKGHGWPAKHRHHDDDDYDDD